VDVLSSRILLRPSDLDRSRRFYRDVLGLAIYRSPARRMILGCHC
jgi:catechol 2,3-dioxygenase-like lactoylglutathione lyase family enzyme